MSGRLVGADPKSDLAVLQIKADLKVQAEWGDSDKLDIGDWVLAIGSPLGFDHSVTAGIVSATERNDVGLAEYESFIQTDAAINPGNSGGPLINLAGKVVGINTAIITQSGGYEGIGLAIPSSLARRVVESLIKNGKVVRGYLGVMLYRGPLDTTLARKLNLPSNKGALVMEVQPGSPAAQVGLKPNDVIVKIADHDVADPAALRILTAGLDAGAQVPMTFYRDGKAADGHRDDRRTPPSTGIALCRWASASASVPPTRRVAEPSSRSTGSSPAARHSRSACAPECVSWPSANLRSRSAHSPNLRPPSENSTPAAACRSWSSYPTAASVPCVSATGNGKQ